MNNNIYNRVVDTITTDNWLVFEVQETMKVQTWGRHQKIWEDWTFKIVPKNLDKYIEKRKERDETKVPLTFD